MNDLPPWLGVLYPFRQHHFGTPEGALNFVDEGRGPAVVMFHGNPSWSFLYRDLILALRPSFRCLALDHLGCGLSAKPQDAGYDLAGHIARAAAWLESLGLESFHLVVHDWGGPIGLGAARESRARVRSISILNTAAFPFPSIPARIAVCRWPLLGALLVRGANGFVRAATRMTTCQPLPGAVQAGFVHPYGNWRDRVAVHRFVQDIPMRPGHRSWATLKSVEADLPLWREKPVQILWGMRDWCFHPGILAAWEAQLPEARVTRCPDAGHYLLEDAGAEAFAAIAELAGAGACRP